MKILYCSSQPRLSLDSPSGYGTHMREMIAAFEAMGHEVLPVIAGGIHSPPQNASTTASYKGQIKRSIPKIVWETIKDMRILFHDRRFQKTLQEKIQGFEPDLIYERAAYMQTGCLQLARKMGIPHAFEINAPFVEERVYFSGPSWLTSLGRKRERTQLIASDHLFFVSEALMNKLIQQHGVIHKSAHVTPNAINRNKFVPNQARVEELRDQLSLTKKHTVIGYVGSMYKWHGVDLLIHSFAQVSKTFPQARLLVVGDGSLRSEMEALTASLSLEDQVVFSGSVPHNEVPNYVELMDVTIMATSNWYSSPVKIFEYGALGKAIIAPNQSPVTEVMQNGEDGLIIDAEEKSSVDALKAFLEAPEMRKKVGQNFQQKVLERHTWNHNVAQVLAAISK